MSERAHAFLDELGISRHADMPAFDGIEAPLTLSERIAAMERDDRLREGAWIITHLDGRGQRVIVQPPGEGRLFDGSKFHRYLSLPDLIAHVHHLSGHPEREGGAG